MNRLAGFTGIVIGVLAVSLAAAAGPAKSKDQVLSAGEYTAKVKAIVCSGCVGLIEKATRGVKGIEQAAAAEEPATLSFKVKKGAKVKLSELQTALNAAAAKMGMGADFGLYELKAVWKKV